MDKKKLYVGNLPWSMTDESLRELFASYGEITEAVVIMDRMSGRSKGFGFVTFATEESAEKATAELNNKAIEGRNIVVNTAKPKEDRGNRGGGFQRNNFRRDDRRGY
ncbi:RNA-binding protein [Candidatus Roizmanbacteria bacterium]|nr:RNA-binding protein [Candidatus Roizmanbacteria bacterium]